MPAFTYRARDAQGKLVEGSLDAPDRAAAIALIERKRFVPFKIDAAGGAPAVAASAPVKAKERTAPAVARSTPVFAAPPAATSGVTLNHAQRLFFTEQLAYLLGAGMTLDEALGVLAVRLKQPVLSKMIRSLHQALIEGRSFSQALRDFPKVFSALYVNLVVAGEASGALTDILSRLVKHLTNMKVLRDRVTQALIYPAFLALAGLGLVILFITVMVPKLQEFFSNASGDAHPLPLPTRILIGSNHVIVTYWWAAIGAGVLFYALFKVATRSPEGRMSWDRMLLAAPGYGSVVRHQYYAQFARTMGTLLQNGVTLLTAVELLEDMSGNSFLHARMIEARAALVDGSSLSVALSKRQVFPELFVDMMAVGEQSGRFAETMQMIADVYERELDARVKIATAIIPNVIIVMIAIVVGFVVFAIISAVFSVTSALPGRMH
jgi:type II secretory pathway component PulF